MVGTGFWNLALQLFVLKTVLSHQLISYLPNCCSQSSISNARNLKLEKLTWAQEGNNFLCVGQMLTFIHLLCTSKRCTGCRGKNPGPGVRGQH